MVLVDGKSNLLFVFNFRSVPKDKLENFRELFTGYLASFIQSGIPTDPTGTAAWTPVNPHAADKPVMQFNLSTADHAFMKPSVYFSNEAQEEPLGMGMCECVNVQRRNGISPRPVGKSNCKLSDLSFKQRICRPNDLMPPRDPSSACILSACFRISPRLFVAVNGQAAVRSSPVECDWLNKKRWGACGWQDCIEPDETADSWCARTGRRFLFFWRKFFVEKFIEIHCKQTSSHQDSLKLRSWLSWRICRRMATRRRWLVGKMTLGLETLLKAWLFATFLTGHQQQSTCCDSIFCEVADVSRGCFMQDEKAHFNKDNEPTTFPRQDESY